MAVSEKALVFLTRHGMEPLRIELSDVVASFMGEMELGLRGRDSSLRMLPTYLRADGELPPGSSAAVVDAGGTNLRTALVSFEDGAARISSLTVTAMPGSEGPATFDEFLETVAERLAPLLTETDVAGVCFSYPAEETPERDGRVLALTKRVRLDGAEGRLVCEGLGEALSRRGVTGKRLVLLNDTPAVTLSAWNEDCRGGLVGLIAGTGVNTCCVVPDSRIRKPHGEFCGLMLINLESGNFSGLPRGDFDAELDAGTTDPGLYGLEKMTSGAYLGELCRLTLRGAASDGLFTPEGTRIATGLASLASPEADAIASNTASPFTGSDAVIASELCRAVFDRAARCVCACLSAILVLTDSGSDPERPALISADGSVVSKSRVFRSLLDGYLESYTAGTLCRYTRLRTGDNATLIGTARAALLN